MPDMSIPGKTIRRWMLARGWGEGELERRSGVRQPTIHRILTGESQDPRRHNLERIAKAFGRSVEDLYDNNSTPAMPTPSERADEFASSARGLSDEQFDLLLRIVDQFQKKP